ncbi:MAG: RICIN domain-containing protein, partial [Coriobacteriales bacterium]|nr:RICIN domain-containing protein [Coriobacteriales bacterium]
GSFPQRGTPIVQWTSHGASNQLWEITVQGGGYVITSAYSNLVLDVSDGIASNGIKVIHWTEHGGPNQNWLFNPVP